MKIVFFGPPGSGKGPQATLISESIHISHLFQHQYEGLLKKTKLKCRR